MSSFFFLGGMDFLDIVTFLADVLAVGRQLRATKKT